MALGHHRLAVPLYCNEGRLGRVRTPCCSRIAASATGIPAVQRARRRIACADGASVDETGADQGASRDSRSEARLAPLCKPRSTSCREFPNITRAARQPVRRRPSSPSFSPHLVNWKQAIGRSSRLMSRHTPPVRSLERRQSYRSCLEIRKNFKLGVS